jgi:hypothetical protein
MIIMYVCLCVGAHDLFFNKHYHLCNWLELLVPYGCTSTAIVVKLKQKQNKHAVTR